MQTRGLQGHVVVSNERDRDELDAFPPFSLGRDGGRGGHVGALANATEREIDAGPELVGMGDWRIYRRSGRSFHASCLGLSADCGVIGFEHARAALAGRYRRVRTKGEHVSPQDEKRFWSKVDKSGDCWNWTGFRDRNGYGRIMIGGITSGAHRCSWEDSFGPIPANMFVCHHCDNPSCINPDHLFLGTHLENVRDMVAKGRQRCGVVLGELHHKAMLTAKQVIEIRIRSELGASRACLAREFGCSESNILCIVRRETWKHVDAA